MLAPDVVSHLNIEIAEGLARHESLIESMYIDPITRRIQMYDSVGESRVSPNLFRQQYSKKAQLCFFMYGAIKVERIL